LQILAWLSSSSPVLGKLDGGFIGCLETPRLLDTRAGLDGPSVGDSFFKTGGGSRLEYLCLGSIFTKIKKGQEKLK
jgi:hypothetical protein